MNPILFAKNETTFTTNGLGRIECISCEVTEERNGMFELEAVVPITGHNASNIEILSIIGAVPYEGGNIQAFFVYKITKPINGRFKVYARHISYRLSDIPSMPFSVTASPMACTNTLSNLKSHAIEPCPFSFFTDVTTANSYTQNVPASIRQRLGGVEGSVIDQFGGELKWDNFNVSLLKQRGRLANVTGYALRYGKNITDIQQEEAISETVTGIVPYWVDTDGNNLVTLTEKVIYSPHASSYPYHLTQTVDFSADFEEAPTEAQLRSVAQAYVNKDDFGIPKVNIKVSFVDLWKTKEYKDIAPLETIQLCDEVYVYFEKLGIEALAKVVKTTYDVLKERYTSIEIGNARTTLAQAVTDREKAIDTAFISQLTRVSTAIADATAWLTNANGYVVAVKNPDGSWKELLFMDTNDPDTATNVLRINNNGLGFSTTGISGPYNNAWTIDGVLVADFVKAGILGDVANKNYWNMVTGEFSLQAGATVGGQTVAQIAQEYADENITAFISNFYAPDRADLQNQLDGRAETWYQATDPSLNWEKGLMITFNSQSETEDGYDWIEIYYKEADNTYSTVLRTGNFHRSFSKLIVKIPSNEFWVHWHTDTSEHDYYGWKVDSISLYTGSEYSETYSTGITDLPAFPIYDTPVDRLESDHPYGDSIDEIYHTSVNVHEGDLWYRTTDNTTWFYDGTQWVQQNVPDEVFDKIDGKAQIFTTQPAPPYFVGDLWCVGSTGDILTCITARTTGSYVASDWAKRNKYTDDTAVNNLNNALTQQEIFNRLTNNGQTQGIYLSNSKLYINASYIGAGTLSANYVRGGTFEVGGNNNGNGVLYVRNASNAIITTMNNVGIDTSYINAKGGYIGNGSYGFKIQNTYIANKLTSVADTSQDGAYYGINGMAVNAAGKHSHVMGSEIVTQGTISSKGFNIGDNGDVNANVINGRFKNLNGMYFVSVPDSHTLAFSHQNGGYLAWAGASDRRVKENIKSISTDTVRKFFEEVEPVQFNYINDEDKKTEFGIIAQDLEKILDDLNVDKPAVLGELEGEEHYKYINYEKMVGLLVAANKDLYEIMESQQSQINELRAEIERLKG